MNMKKSLISISSVTAILLLTACSSSSNNSSIDLNGTVVDGYVSGADVMVGGISTKSDARGAWSISDVTFSNNMTVEASGGIDTSTGEAFEGRLKATIAKFEDKDDVVLTPLSTVIASMVTSGSTLEEATLIVSEELNISTDSLKTDPIAILKGTNSTTEEKEHAAIVLKKSLVFQKMAETVSSSVGTTSEEQNEIFDEVVNSFSNILKANKAAESNTTFDEVLADTASITDKVATSLESNEGADENLRAKLEASGPSAAQTVKSVEAIDEKVFSQAADVETVMQIQGKAIEVVTSAIETGVEQISKSIDESAADAAAIAAAQAEAEKTTQAITMLGGVAGVAVALEEEAAKQATDTTTDNTTDASTFSESIFSTENIEAQSTIYETLAESGMTEDMIASVGTTISEKQDTATPIDFAQVVADLVEATPDVVIDTAAQATIAAAVEESSTAAVTATAAAAEESSYDATDTGERTIIETGYTPATLAIETFTITPDINETYTHTITGFDTKVDKLDFGTGVNSNHLPITNTADDGTAELYYTPDSGLTNVYIILDGLTQEQDMALTTSNGVDAILK